MGWRNGTKGQGVGLDWGTGFADVEEAKEVKEVKEKKRLKSWRLKVEERRGTYTEVAEGREITERNRTEKKREEPKTQAQTPCLGQPAELREWEG